MSQSDQIFDGLFKNATCICISGGQGEPSFQCENCWTISYVHWLRHERFTLRKELKLERESGDYGIHTIDDICHSIEVMGENTITKKSLWFEILKNLVKKARETQKSREVVL